MMYDLVEYKSETITMVDPIERELTRTVKVQSHVRNTLYPICKDMKTKLEARTWPKGTFFKIIENK